MDIPYPHRIRKMVTDHAEIMAKMPEGLVGEEERVCLDSPKPDVAHEVEEEDAPQASWMEKGHKRQNIVQIPPQVRQRTLQILQGNSQYFADMRQNYLQTRADSAKGSLTDLELVATRLDDRIIQAQQFLEDDEFIKYNEFKSF